ncbi:hypothetical protein OAX78_04115 [Planctomycetota bacterium]|nr:hypothetical protein [Planctomycetota bacterium]
MKELGAGCPTLGCVGEPTTASDTGDEGGSLGLVPIRCAGCDRDMESGSVVAQRGRDWFHAVCTPALSVAAPEWLQGAGSLAWDGGLLVLRILYLVLRLVFAVAFEVLPACSS